MTTSHHSTKTLTLIPLTRDQTLAMIEASSPEDQALVSPEWLAAVRASADSDP
jgi:hypothetical protein